jgi:glycosyltransferase involved in cell wall biosynthesis
MSPGPMQGSDVRPGPDTVSRRNYARPERPFARVSVVIPTLNEAANLPHVFAKLPTDERFEVIVVDGHSTDDTIAVAQALRPDIRIVLQDGRGKGNALACGFAAARGHIIVMLDADGSTDPAEIPQYLEPLFNGADYAKGSRFMPGGASVDITPIRQGGNRVLTTIVNRLYRTSYTDLCYGYNAFWADVLPIMNVNCSGFEVETLINVRVAHARLTVAEVASIEYERINGVSKLHPVRDGLRVLRTILTEYKTAKVSRAPAQVTELAPAAADEGLSTSFGQSDGPAEPNVAA